MGELLVCKEKGRHTPQGLGMKPGTSANFLLHLLPYLTQMCLQLY